MLAALVDLDDVFAAGQVTEPEYREQRAMLQTKLRALLAADAEARSSLPSGTRSRRGF
ncbi:MAG: hypothetical protein HY690_02590 [Chloroflexi bacterium]|nr:hypothetical protein [Chloroflexota bacterium]